MGAWDLVVTVASSSVAGSIVSYLLLRRRHAAEQAQAEADAVERYQRVVAELWGHIAELEARANDLKQKMRALEDEVRVLRRLLQAYERRYGRRFRIVNGDVIEDQQ